MNVVTRRELLSAATATPSVLLMNDRALGQSRAPLRAARYLSGSDYDWSAVRGFNYQPSYGATGLDIWTNFNPDLIRAELDRGKRYFPKINSLRIWLSWEAFRIDQVRFADNLESFLKIVDENGCRAMPILFNRWRSIPDFGGVYMDNFMPGSLARDERAFDGYIDAVIGQHRDDPRILIWDLCNEPYFNQEAVGASDETPAAVAEAETAWLRSVYRKAKALRPVHPVTVAAHGKHSLSRVNEFSDVLTIHPYWMTGLISLEEFVHGVEQHVAYARAVGKPLFASECCLGRTDDDERTTIIRATLAVLKARGIGWMPDGLHHSMVADEHRPEFGSYSGLFMAFIESDGSLRRGHEAFNEF